GYAREAGVRNFEKNLDKIHRKLAKRIVDASETIDSEESAVSAESNNPVESNPAEKTVEKAADTISEKVPVYNSPAEKNPADKIPMMKFAIDKKLIEEHLGKPIFPEGEVKRADRPGMSVGLAWTSMGGDTLVIEATSVPGKEGLTLTGKMGDTMKESATIAMTVAEKLGTERYGVDPSWFEKNHIHLHIPEGATPKDGPSAGITMATALLSLIRNRTVTDRLVMTGELSLTGQVLPIGGLKEKTIAAQRNKARHIIIPKQNLRDLDEIPENVKKGVQFHPVERFDEVLALALPD
ncbi:MAG: endopeptidase La, partial [Treponema sp.]|nr:endopeptidase La [Treponema sp.]